MNREQEASEKIAKHFTNKCNEQDCYVNKNLESQEPCVMCKRSTMNKMTGGTKTDNFMTMRQKYGD